MAISMTENGDPLENAVAERVNGIIKSEWLCEATIKTRSECSDRIIKAIKAYNDVRPHMSLDFQTPSQIHDLGAVPKNH